jgi:hypothetical protein
MLSDAVIAVRVDAAGLPPSAVHRLPVLLLCAHPWLPGQRLAAVQRMPVQLLAAAVAS